MLAAHPLVGKLDRLLKMTDGERRAASCVPVRFADIGAHQDVDRAGERPSRCALVVKGLLCTSKVTASGNRQITAFHVRGDWPGLLSLHQERLDEHVRTVSPSTVAFIDHVAIRSLCHQYPRITVALWKMALIEAAIYAEWVVNIGQRPAVIRLAHLFCEVMVRTEAVGMALDGRCSFMATQVDLSEATGLTVVHVNRMLQELRARKLISFNGVNLIIHDWAALSCFAEFQPDYLHITSDPFLAINKEPS